jgi:hypothetical protein
LCHEETHALQQIAFYSITSSARPSSGIGTVIPMAAKVRVEIDKRFAYFAGVFLIDAKDDRLGIAIGLLKEFGEMMRNRLSAGAKGYNALEIFGLVFIVGYLPAEAIHFVPTRAPARSIPLCNDAMNPVGSKETVVDTLP